MIERGLRRSLQAVLSSTGMRLFASHQVWGTFFIFLAPVTFLKKTVFSGVFYLFAPVCDAECSCVRSTDCVLVV